MSSTTLPDEIPVDPDDELLVAYLDGELSRADEASLETRLLEDDQLRRRLQQLQSGWDLLEDLPDPTPNLNLIESTLELAVADIVGAEPETVKAKQGRKWPLGLVAVASLAGMLIAVVAAAVTRNYVVQQQLRELAIVEDVDAYLRGKDLELMRQLAASPDWNAMVTALREVGELEFQDGSKVADTEMPDRAAMLQELPVEERRQLNLRWDRYSSLQEPDREEIRRTARAVEQQPDADLLLKTMRTYAQWIQNLPTDLRDRIESSDPTTRRQAITEAVDNTQYSITQRSKLKLEDETIEWIYFALQQIVRQRVDEGDQATIAVLDRARERPEFAEYDKWPAIAAIVFEFGRGERGPRGGGGPPGGRGGPGGRRRGLGFLGPLLGSMASSGGGFNRPRSLTPQELNTIRLVLPESAMDTLDLIASGDALLETTTLRAWAEEAAKRNSPFHRDENLTWLERYNEMPPSERDRLDLLAPKDFIRELSSDSPFP